MFRGLLRTWQWSALKNRPYLLPSCTAHPTRDGLLPSQLILMFDHVARIGLRRRHPPACLWPSVAAPREETGAVEHGYSVTKQYNANWRLARPKTPRATDDGRLAHDPEKHARTGSLELEPRDHAQTKKWNGMTDRGKVIALQCVSPSFGFAGSVRVSLHRPVANG